jgi:hypothetical protein
MKYLIFIFSLSLFSSCAESLKRCDQPQDGKAVLVAYRVAKSTHLWFQDPTTDTIYDINGVGGRREPNISLGDTIKVQYCDGRIVFNRYNYVKQPVNRKTRYKSLKGYEGLY